MPNLNISIDNLQFPRPNQFFSTVNAVRNLYYALLFSMDTAYRGRADTWAYWLRIGTDHNVREPLRIARPEDRLRLTTRSNLRKIEIECISGNQAVLGRAGRLFTEIDASRSKVLGKSNDARLHELADSEVIAGQLIEPVKNSADTKLLRRDERESIAGMVSDILVKLSHPNIASIMASLN